MGLCACRSSRLEAREEEQEREPEEQRDPQGDPHEASEAIHEGDRTFLKGALNLLRVQLPASLANLAQLEVFLLCDPLEDPVEVIVLVSQVQVERSLPLANLAVFCSHYSEVYCPSPRAPDDHRKIKLSLDRAATPF